MAHLCPCVSCIQADGAKYLGSPAILRPSVEEEKVEAVKEYREVFASPYKAAELGYIDEIIFPRQTRIKILQALDMTKNKSKNNPPKKHGNIPL